MAAGVAGCGGCGGDAGSTTLPVAATAVEEVRVVPDTILAQPGAVFTLEAVAKGKYGVRVDVAGDPGLTWEWTAPAAVIADPTANPATVTVPNAPGTTFELSAEVVESGSSSIVSNTVTVKISGEFASDILTDTDWVFAEHPANHPPAALLVEARDDKGAVVDWTVGVVGHVGLDRNFDPDPARPTEAALFARGRYIDLRPAPSESGGPWTTASDQLEADPMDHGGFRFLSVRIGVDDPGKTVAGVPVATWVESELRNAFGLLDQNRAGIELDFVDVFKHGLVGDAKPGTHCNHPADYLPDWNSTTYQQILYVLYVPDVTIESGGVTHHLTGWACQPTATTQANRVVFLSWVETFPATLAHELGHVLSLAPKYGPGGNGHVDGLYGFDMSNLMYDQGGLIYGSTRHHLSLGQLYRMNAHKHSWLDLTVPTGTSYGRACQASAAAGTCPAAAADVGATP